MEEQERPFEKEMQYLFERINNLSKQGAKRSQEEAVKNKKLRMDGEDWKHYALREKGWKGLEV